MKVVRDTSPCPIPSEPDVGGAKIKRTCLKAFPKARRLQVIERSADQMCGVVAMFGVDDKVYLASVVDGSILSVNWIEHAEALRSVHISDTSIRKES